MDDMSTKEQSLLSELLTHPRRHNNRYTHAAACDLRQILFKSLSSRRTDYLHLFFPSGPPPDQSQPWSLREAQGAEEGAEYTAAARGTACGHIFKSGESSYHCKTCSIDETCVLCSRCYEGSDHEGHMVMIMVSAGNSGCCDCGDDEAWRRKVRCSIHTAGAGEEGGKEKEKAEVPGGSLPPDLIEAVRMTVGRAVDYMCDVFSCSPEQLRLPKTEAGIRQDERTTRLASIYGSGEEEDENGDVEYALLLWNDEKHTVDEVTNQVARACKQSKPFGRGKALEVDEIGRSIIHFSKDVQELLQMSKIIEQLKVTATIRSARDTFREQMCSTIVDWIADISGCSVGSDAHILRQTVCEEFLNPWRMGSEASNKEIGKEGIDDHELEENMKSRREYLMMLPGLQMRGLRGRAVTIDEEGNIIEEEIPQDDEDEDAMIGTESEEDDEDMDYDEDEDMDIDPMDAHLGNAAVNSEMDLDFLDDNEDMTEALEATIAGYPPPPPPPGRRHGGRTHTPESEDGDATNPTSSQTVPEPYSNVPKTPKGHSMMKARSMRASKHWLVKPHAFEPPHPAPPCEDLWQRVRLDYLVLYDLRLWKVLRNHIRHLYITTLITLPSFKRLLGLRFAGLYTALSQLYLIADREPDHSIINLSVQILTTPTITQEVVSRANFLTNLLATLYTFLTTRQVGFPEEVSPRATLAFDAGAVTNRRITHFFNDLRWMLQAPWVRGALRAEQAYLLQFLDLIKLYQGVCPNVRARGEHVEYESDAWLQAQMVVKEMNRLCKLVAASFEPGIAPDSITADEVSRLLCRAIRTTAQVTLINAMGMEKTRFHAAEIKEGMKWHSVGPVDDDGLTLADKHGPLVPEFVVQKEPMSFHHPLHYLLSWIIEYAKEMTPEHIRSLLSFSMEDLKDPWSKRRGQLPTPANLTSANLLSAIFDAPLRICVWLSQMKAGMWVRNGYTLRHQANGYRSVAVRDVGYQRDLFMIQAGLVLVGSDEERPGERFLAQMLDRFQMFEWSKGDFSVMSGFEEGQQLDVIEDFFHLLVVAICERSNLLPNSGDQHVRLLQYDIAHALCFKPLSYSELGLRITEKISDAEDFASILDGMTTYRPPEGLNDTGTFELKSEFIELIDPYYAHYSRNQREEAEGIYKKHMARKTGKPVEDIVYEPTLPSIESGLFRNLSAFTSTRLFVRVISAALTYATEYPNTVLQITRIETFLHIVLHLVLLAVTEDGIHHREFVKLATATRGPMGLEHYASLVSLLVNVAGMDKFASCHPTIKHILRRMQLQQPDKLTPIIGPLGVVLDRSENDSPASLSLEDKERKKQEARARQARIMAQMKQAQNSFLQNQGLSGFTDAQDDDDMMSIGDETDAAHQKKTWAFPSGTCIWCQEETDERRLYGSFAFFAKSNILRATPMDDPDFVKEVLDTPESLDRPADDVRPFGVSGRNRRTVEKIGENGSVVVAERQGLSKGFPRQTVVTNGPVATTCGHIMHFSCFELYMQHNHRRHAQQIARHHPEKIELKEFTCPLCKALGNAFLPIVWKPKECAPENDLHAAEKFADWLEQVARGFPEFHDTGSQQNLYDRLSQYVQNNFAASLAVAFQGLTVDSPPGSATSTQDSTPSLLTRRSSGLTGLLLGYRSPSQALPDRSTPDALANDPATRMLELSKAYARLDETMRVNKLQEPDQPLFTLSRALGMSISAFEIAHRGSSSDILGTSSVSLLSELPEQGLIHFRILSETMESYMAYNVMRAPWQQRGQETTRRKKHLQAQLMGFDTENNQDEVEFVSTLFKEDIFLAFVDWLSFMAPNVAEASSMLQLYLWAEVVKALFGYSTILLNPEFEQAWGETKAMATPSDAFSEVVHSLVGRLYDEPGDAEKALSRERLALLRKIVDKYALAFLRKAIIVMHVRYGLDFECPFNLDPESPELQRLTKLLHIPSIDDMAEVYSKNSPGGAALRKMTIRWISGGMSINTAARHLTSKPISLSHPAIFELVGLPKTYDTLTEEAVRGKCPTTGKEMTDPALCLFCGDVFCSQAVCCTQKRLGGCNQHMAKCGGNVGLFIHIKKCSLLFLHAPGNGSFSAAPYLNKHGESDPGLRHHHPLFLNQRRYDKLLREVWLQHGIQAVVSRKLEADINPGGWETL